MFTYTGNSSTNDDAMTFNHSLGVPIDFAIGKCRDTASAQGGNWVVWHKDLTGTYPSLYLNQTEQVNTSDNNVSGWFTNQNNGSQHQAKIRNVEIYDYAGNTDTVRMVDNSKDFVFYGWAGVEGYSKFGTYTGSSDGPMVYTGHTPRWLAIKRTNSSDHWCLYDTARYPDNPNGTRLEADTSDDETSASTINIDVLSNGFKLRGAGSTINASGSTYVYASFSESPFKHANAR
jgi:FlaG/FlaF family flagellin (archaellin)